MQNNAVFHRVVLYGDGKTGLSLAIYLYSRAVHNHRRPGTIQHIAVRRNDFLQYIASVGQSHLCGAVSSGGDIVGLVAGKSEGSSGKSRAVHGGNFLQCNLLCNSLVCNAGSIHQTYLGKRSTLASDLYLAVFIHLEVYGVIPKLIAIRRLRLLQSVQAHGKVGKGGYAVVVCDGNGNLTVLLAILKAVQSKLSAAQAQLMLSFVYFYYAYRGAP